MKVQQKKQAPPTGHIFYWGLIGLCSLGLAWTIATRISLAVILLTMTLIVLIVRKKMLWGVCAILMLPVIGELYRLPIGGESGTLLSDIAIAGLVTIWAIEKFRLRKKISNNKFLVPLGYFFGAGIFSLIFSLTFLKFSEMAAGSLYLFRFAEYVLLGIVTFDSIKTNKDRHTIVTWMVIAAVCIAVAGFIQLIIYPDLGKLEEYGWDPHQNRLVSTWLDPNFIAGFLGYITSILAGITVYTKNFLKKTGLFLVIGILVTALFLTYSRSGYVAAATSLGLIGILKSRKLLIGGIILMMIGLNFSPRAQERVEDLMHSIQSLVFNTNENPDATARLRIVSWNQTLELIQKRPWFGSGYNTLKYVKYNEGFVSDPSVHSASGSDSSILTVLATTGIAGTIPFLILHWEMMKLAFLNWKKKNTGDSEKETSFQGYGLGVFCGLTGLAVHSLFVNSLLFPQILITLWISAGLLKTQKQN